MARKRRSREDWARLVAEFQQQGLSQREFARRRGVKLATFRYWLANLRDVSHAEPVRFVEVVTPEGAGGPGDGVWIRLPGGLEPRLESLPRPEYLVALDAELARQRS